MSDSHTFTPVPRRKFIQALCIGSIVLIAIASDLSAQAVPPAKNDSEIVINPTLSACSRGWTTNDRGKWTKEQFDVFCATLTGPAEIVANPTLTECAKGWEQTQRWNKERFDEFCTLLKSSK